MRTSRLTPHCYTLLLTSLALATGCGAVDNPAEDPAEDTVADSEPELGSLEQALSAACTGDDSDADVAALAVAAANELGRWDALSDFEVVNNQLQLSPTGEIRCEGWRNEDPGGCENIRAVLALQSDASAVISHHTPATLRSKLVSWYQNQRAFLTSTIADRAKLAKGLYRIRSRSSSRYLTVDAANIVQQSTSTTATTAQVWAVALDGTSYQLKNASTDQCLDLEVDSSGLVRLLQRACSTSTSQDFRFGDLGTGYHGIFSKYGKALRANTPTSASVVAGVTQDTFAATLTNEQWSLEPYGSASHVAINDVPEGVYSMAIRHSGQYLAVDGGMTEDFAVIEQRTYEAWDDRYHWYLSHSGTGYEVINRRSGKCIDLETPSSSTSGLWQRVCSGAASQRFTFKPTGDGYLMMFTMYGRSVEIRNSDMTSDARLFQGATTWAPNRQLMLNPIAAGEPHVLTFSRSTSNGPCGNYSWYNITRPNRQALKAPAETFMQLIFAGGKQSLTGSDTNPYIAQQVSGNQVAIDPTYGLTDDGTTSVGACAAACTKISTSNTAGHCCSCNGVTKTFRRAAWNANTFLCL